MTPLANAGAIWLAATVIYLALQPAWDYLVGWTADWPGRPGAWLATVRDWRFASQLRMAGQLLYYLAVPYGALLLGIADARRLGLVAMPRWPELPVGAVTGLGSMLLVAWMWGGLSALSFRGAGRKQLLFDELQSLYKPWGWVLLVGQVLCLQMSWAFVRGAAIRAFGLYLGTFVGLGLAGMAWILRPSTRAALADPDSRAGALLPVNLAIISALVFVYAENLWLSATIHGLALLAVLLAAGRPYGGAGKARGATARVPEG